MFKSNLLARGYALTVLGSLSAAFFFIPYKHGIATIPAEVFVSAMFILGFGINGLSVVLKREKMHIFSIPTLLGALLLACLTIFANFAIGKSLEGVSSSITSVFARTEVIFVILMGWLLLREKLNIFLIPGGLIALLGFVGMNFQSDMQLSDDFSYYLWGICAGLGFGGTQVFIKIIVNRVNPFAINYLRLLFGAVLMVLFPGVLTGLLELSWTGWLLAGASTIFGPICSRILYIYALKYTPVSQFTLFTMLTPIFALLVDWIFLGEIPTFQQTLGACIIMVGILLPVFHLIRQSKPS